MMDDDKLVPAQPVESGDPVLELPAEAPLAPAADAAAPVPVPVPVSAAVEKFKSCRWRCSPEDGEFCTHRDVLPFAGKDGFVADSWCPDCAFYKLRRTPKKRERVDYTY